MPWSKTSSLQNFEIINFCLLSHSVCILCYGSHIIMTNLIKNSLKKGKPVWLRKLQKAPWGKWFFFFFLFLVVKSRGLYRLGKCSTSEPYPKPPEVLTKLRLKVKRKGQEQKGKYLVQRKWGTW
jgi:hypothetical protein